MVSRGYIRRIEIDNTEPEYTTLPELLADAKAGKFDHPKHGIGTQCNKCECLILAARWERIREPRYKAVE